MNQHTWVQQCQNYYEENGLTPEPGGEWQEAHYPAPKGAGSDTIWLMHDHHQVQGLYQSEEYGRPCFFNSYVKAFLDNNWCQDWFYLYDLYEKWAGCNGRANVVALNEHENTRKARSANGKANVTVMNAHPGTLENQRRQGKANGKVSMTPDKARGFGKANAPTMNDHVNTFENRRKQGQSTGSSNAKTMNGQKWQCLVTGFVSSPGALSIYQKSKGIDTSLRVRLEG